MVEKVLYGQMAEAMLIGIPALTIVITFMVQIGMCLVNKVRQVREDGKLKLFKNYPILCECNFEVKE